MNINDIFSVLEQLGVKVEENDGIIEFYDVENELPMEIWEDKKKQLPLNDVQTVRYYTLFSGEKMVRMQIKNPVVNGKRDKNSLILSRVQVDDKHEEHLIDLMYGRNVGFRVQSWYKDEDEIVEQSEVFVNGDQYIDFDAYGKNGVYDHRFDTCYGITSDEMVEALESIKPVSIFAEYYGKLYPQLKYTIDKALENKAKSGMSL